jgi:hypothetical protein
MHCYVIINHIYIYISWFIYLKPWKFTIFSTDGVNGVKNFKYMFTGFIILCLWSGQSSTWFFLRCFFLVVQALFLSHVVNF